MRYEEEERIQIQIQNATERWDETRIEEKRKWKKKGKKYDGKCEIGLFKNITLLFYVIQKIYTCNGRFENLREKYIFLFFLSSMKLFFS